MATRVERVIPLFASATKVAGETDRELLMRFGAGDEAAFAVLVTRHAGMVLGVCRRVLPTVQDAEDACQATFLVLSRKAAAGDWQASLANWLYGTARRIAARANRTTRRRAKREVRPAPPDAPSALDQMTGREAFAALDAELDRLPPMYRAPLVLCHLEGLTRDEAAARLGVPLATLKSRLDRGRKRLADALAKRGVGLGAGLLAVAATSPAGASLPRLLDSILATVGGHPPETVAALATGVTVNTWTIKGLLAATAALVGIGLASMPTAAEQPKPTMKADKPGAKDGSKKPEATERTITGKVLDADGKPVAAELRLVWIDAKPTPLGKANADGTFKVTVPMVRGEYGGWLVATAPGHGPDFVGHGFDYKPSSMTPTVEVTLKLPKERLIEGRILDQQGKPVVGARVTASNFSAFDSDASWDEHFQAWATQNYNRGVPPGGDRNMYFPGEQSDHRRESGPSPYTAATDKDGRYKLAGIGANQLVRLRIRGAGVADKEIVALNRDGFDPAPVNKLAKDNEFKGYSFGGKWALCGADPSVVLDQEKIIRGRVTDHEGKPRVGVTVAFTRPNKRELTQEWNQAVTDKDGKYEIRGARKHKGYMVELPPDPAAGLLECQAFADDTVGYEPVVIDIKQARGVVVTGRVTNKATGKPVPSNVYAEVMANNPFADQYPPFLHSASSANRTRETDKDGRYRVVVIPGRVVLSAAPSKGDGGRYRPAVSDPKHAASFHPSEGALMYDSYGGGRGFVQGNWCRVLEAKPGDTELTVDIELEPATKTLVKVADADGKSVTGVKATGVEIREFARATEVTGDTLTAFNVDVTKERLVAVRHEKRNLVGTLNLTAETKDPVVKLGAAGTVTGRAVDQDGKPLAGLSVEVRYDHRQVQEVSGGIRDGSSISTDANGEFKLDGLFPGQAFRVFFNKGRTRFGPDYDKTPKRTVAKHGDTLKLGDVKLEPATNDGE